MYITEWHFGLVVLALVISSKLQYVEPS